MGGCSAVGAAIAQVCILFCVFAEFSTLLLPLPRPPHFLLPFPFLTIPLLHPQISGTIDTIADISTKPMAEVRAEIEKQAIEKAIEAGADAEKVSFLLFRLGFGFWFALFGSRVELVD